MSSNIIGEIEINTIIDIVASSDGDLALAAERLNRQHNLPYNTITEYALQTRLSAIDVQTADNLATRFRTLLTIKLFALIATATEQMSAALGDLRPAELARTHASLVNSFTALTAPATKITFDFNKELEDLAREFPDIPIEEMKANIKEMEQKVKIRAVK